MLATYDGTVREKKLSQIPTISLKRKKKKRKKRQKISKRNTNSIPFRHRHPIVRDLSTRNVNTRSSDQIIPILPSTSTLTSVKRRTLLLVVEFDLVLTTVVRTRTPVATETSIRNNGWFWRDADNRLESRLAWEPTDNIWHRRPYFNWNFRGSSILWMLVGGCFGFN